MVVYHRFQPGELGTYCMLSGQDGCARDGSGSEDGGGDEDRMRRKGIVWWIVGVRRIVVSTVVEAPAVVGEEVLQMSWRETASGWGNNGL